MIYYKNKYVVRSTHTILVGIYFFSIGHRPTSRCRHLAALFHEDVVDGEDGGAEEEAEKAANVADLERIDGRQISRSIDLPDR